MTPEQYTRWLSGYVEITGGKLPSEEEWKKITASLDSVFNKVTPNFGRDRQAFIPDVTNKQAPVFIC